MDHETVVAYLNRVDVSEPTAGPSSRSRRPIELASAPPASNAVVAAAITRPSPD